MASKSIIMELACHRDPPPRKHFYLTHILFFPPRKILTSTFHTNLIATRLSLLPSMFTGSVFVCNLAHKIHNLLCVPSGFHLVINAVGSDLVFRYD